MIIDLRQTPEARTLLETAFPDCKVARATVRHGVTCMSLRSYWDEGRRSYFAVVRLSDGKLLHAPNSHPFFNADVQGVDNFIIPDGFVVVERQYIGASERVVFHVPGASTLLPAPAIEITDDEALLLVATRSLKSSYAGVSDQRGRALRQRGWTQERIDAVRASCQAKGWLDKRLAITIAGRNAIESHPLRYENFC